MICEGETALICVGEEAMRTIKTIVLLVVNTFIHMFVLAYGQLLAICSQTVITKLLKCRSSASSGDRL